MERMFCENEQEVLEAIQSGRWPEGCDPSLHEHVAGCAVCAEVVLVAGALRQEAAVARGEVRLPEGGAVWWKAQLRARREAAERATLPIKIVEKVAGVSAAVALVWGLVWHWPRIQGLLNHFGSALRLNQHGIPNVLLGPWNQMANYLLIMLATACLLFVASVIYLLRVED
jgi:hypothetical protein